MPVIRQYETQTSAPGAPGVGGIDFGNAVGDLGVTVQRAAAQLKDIQGRQEVSDVQVKLAQARAEWTVELEKRATEAPAGDPEFAATFATDFENYLSQQGADYATPQGRMAWQTGSAELGSHFVQTAGVYQINSMGVKARADYNTALDLNRNVLQHDPSQLDSVLQSTLAALDNPDSPYARMDADTREKLKNTTKNELGWSAFQGLAAKNPNEALRQLAAGDWDSKLDADKMSSANNLAERLIRAQELDLQRAVAAEERAAKATSKATQNEYFHELAKDTADPLAKQLMLDDRVLPEDKRSMLGVIERTTKPDTAAEISHATSSALFDRIHSEGPDRITDENTLNDAFSKGLLNRTDLDWLRKEVANARTPEGDMLGKRMTSFFDRISPQIDARGAFGVPTDPRGAEQMYRFEDMARRKVQEYKQQKKDPYTLFDPASPDYLGKPETVESFQTPLVKRTLGIVEGIGAPNDNLLDEPGNEEPGFWGRLFGSSEPAPLEDYKSAADVAAAYQANKITREQATKILRDKGWAK